MMLYGKILYHSKIGYLTLLSDEHYIRKISFGKHELGKDAIIKDSDILKEAEKQILEYIDGKRKVFTVPYQFSGTSFQESVWAMLCEIPYGETWTYKEMAEAVGRPRSARAVGGACHNNPIAIIVPCHRVVGANGSLTGFGGGIPVKETLLNLETVNKNK